MEILHAASSWSRTEEGDGGGVNSSDDDYDASNGVWSSAQNLTKKGRMSLSQPLLNFSSSGPGT